MIQYDMTRHPIWTYCKELNEGKVLLPTHRNCRCLVIFLAFWLKETNDFILFVTCHNTSQFGIPSCLHISVASNGYISVSHLALPGHDDYLSMCIFMSVGHGMISHDFYLPSRFFHQCLLSLSAGAGIMLKGLWWKWPYHTWKCLGIFSVGMCF